MVYSRALISNYLSYKRMVVVTIVPSGVVVGGVWSFASSSKRCYISRNGCVKTDLLALAN